jgi:hypothetical protein
LICDFLLKAAGVLTAVAVAVATLGIPLPVPFSKDIAQAFPCMNCSCGCVNAEMCWRQCCCYTNAEKLTWASQHGVRVPEFVLEQVAAELKLGPTQLADVKPCCRQRILAAQARSCCDRNSENCHQAEDVDRSFVPGVLAIHALKCQGLSLSLSLLPPTIRAHDLDFQMLLVPGENILLAERPLYQSPFFDAVVPPPESATL